MAGRYLVGGHQHRRSLFQGIGPQDIEGGARRPVKWLDPASGAVQRTVTCA